MKFPVVLFSLAASMVYAQDTRHVTEPKIPQACNTLTASLSAPRGSLPEADEGKLDSQRIQQALDSCSRGQAVVLKASGSANAFLSGPLQLRAGVTLVIDRGAILLASRNPRLYDVTPGGCGVVSRAAQSCKPLISGDGVADAGLMGDGIIDGRGGAKLLGQDLSWWDVAAKANVRPVIVGVSGRQQCPYMMVLNKCDNFTLYRLTLRNSPHMFVTYRNGDGFTVWGLKVWAPGEGARNTDGIDPGNSSNVTITHCFLHTGDDNVCLKPGAGRPTTHVSVTHNHFYTGHGMSIGSETAGGTNSVRVSDLTMDGTKHGIRIKSNNTRGGPVTDAVYEDVCIRNVGDPIVMDADYTNFQSQAKGLIPDFSGIVLRNVRVIGGGNVILNGSDAAHRLGITFDNVILENPDKIKITAKHARVTEGPGPVNFVPEGEDVAVEGKPGKDTPNSCQDRFVPFPDEVP